MCTEGLERRPTIESLANPKVSRRCEQLSEVFNTDIKRFKRQSQLFVYEYCYKTVVKIISINISIQKQTTLSYHKRADLMPFKNKFRV